MNHSQMGVHQQQQQHNPSYNFNNGAAPPPPPAAAPEVHHCLWDDCQRVAPDAETLYLHLCNDHIGRKSTQNLCLTCHWKGCEISCAKRDHITSHLRVHTPLKPHGCPVCSKTFKRPQDLKKHERIHTQEHHSAHKHSKAAVSEDPEFADRVLAGTAPAEKKPSSGLLVPRGRAARESFSSAGSREGSTPEFASPKSNSLSPHSFSSHSDPLTTPPPDHFLPYPQLSTSQGSNDFGPNNTLLQNPYALQNNMYTLAGGGGYPNQPQLHHPQTNQYPGQQSWDGGAQTGQKRGYDLGGFFDEVKKRKVEPRYDHEMARRLEEMTRGLATVGSGGISPADGHPSPLPTHFNPLPSPSHHQLPHHSSIPNNVSFPNLGQPNFLDQFNSSGPLPDFHNETEVAQTNSFLFNLLMGATAQQQNLRGGSPSFNGSDGSRSNGDQQQQQQQHQQSNAPPIFDANVLAQMGLAGMPGLDPSVLFGSMQLQQQFQLQQQQQQQIRELQEQLALQQRMGQSGVNFGSNGALYPNLHDPNSYNNNNQAQQQFSRRTSVPNSGSSSVYGTPPVSLSNRPIAQLPSGNGRSSSLTSLPSAPPNLGMQTLFTGNAPQLPTPNSAVPTFDSSAPSPANSHASSSHYSSSSSEIFSFNEASDHESSQAGQFGRNGSHGAYHQHPSPGFSASFDSLARSRGPSVQTGLAPVNLLANTYRMMEPLSSAAPRESNERGSGGVEEEEEDEQVVMSSPKGLENVDEEDEELHSPSDVAMKGPHRSQTSSSSSSSEEILSSSPPLPSTLIASSSLKDFDPELKLPSINASYSLSHFRTSSNHQGSASPTPSSPSSSHSHSTTRPTTPTNGTTLPPLSALYPDLARPWSADELVKGVHGISGLGGAAERESKAKEAERHVELIKALLIAVNDKWRKTVALQAASQVKVEVKVEEAEMMRVGGGEGLTA